MGKLKIVYPICCGIDVHRDFLIACIASTNTQGITEYQSRRFSTYAGSLRELRDWLFTNGCKDVCMESTGKYWFPVHNILEGSCHVVVSHPNFVQEAVDGTFTHERAEKFKIIRSHMDSLEKCKAELESVIPELAQKYQLQIELLMTVPGIHSAFSAIHIPAEIGADMTVFDTSKHLCSWAGLPPQNAESTGKKKTSRIGKSGAYLNPLLIQAALAASRSEKHPEIYGKKNALQKRRGKKKAMIAIAR